MDGKARIPLIFPIPSVITNYGRSRSGKSTLIEDIVNTGRFVPNPREVYYLVGGSSEQEVWDKALPLVEAIGGSLNLTSKDVHIFRNLPAFTGAIEHVDNDTPRIVVVDDLMADHKGVLPGMSDLACVTSHHKTLTVIFNTQELFISGSKVIRENSDYKIIWPCFGVNNLKRFLRDYPPQVLDKVISIHSMPRQLANDMAAQTLIENNLPLPEEMYFRSPAILYTPVHSNTIVVYAGIFDSDPLVVISGAVDANAAKDVSPELVTELFAAAGSRKERQFEPGEPADMRVSIVKDILTKNEVKRMREEDDEAQEAKKIKL